MSKTYWRIKASGNPAEATAFLGSLSGVRGTAYKRWEDDRLSIELASTEPIGQGNGWCKFLLENVQGFQYYYVIGEIADRPQPDGWMTFDLPISPLDKDFATYIQQCQKRKMALFHTLSSQLIEMPIANPEIFQESGGMAQQTPSISGEIFNLMVYESHDIFVDAKKHRPIGFLAHSDKNVVF